MQCWTMNQPGRDHLRLARVAVPQPNANEVLLKVQAVALNYRDKLVIEGRTSPPPTYPFTPVSDLVGTVVAQGSHARHFSHGDRVITHFVPDWIDGKPTGDASATSFRSLASYYPGVMAEYVVLPENWLTRAPSSLDDSEASTLPIAGLTAWYALIERGQVKAGETVVIQGTGGVALFALQFAKAHGARVIITSSSDEKLARAAALGADDGINRHEQDWAAAVLRLTDGAGADHILELAGGSNFAHSLQAIATGGRISFIGVLEGYDFSGSFAFLGRKRVTVEGSLAGSRRAQQDMVRAIDRISLKPVIDTRFSFSDLPAALARLDQGPFGKIVLTL
ncbi:MAG: NAD(P)-dependent alcohol dehydrogenase [Rhizomicrobium sp.]